MTAWNREDAARLVDGPLADLLWDAEAADLGEETPSADYVDGWNDAVQAQSMPLAEQLTAAIAHIDVLEERPVSVRFTRCSWCGVVRDVEPDETMEQITAIATEHAWSCIANPVRTGLQAQLDAERRARAEDAAEARATIASMLDEQAKLAGDVAMLSNKLDECMLRGAVLVAERDRWRADAAGHADRALELAARVTELEQDKETENA